MKPYFCRFKISTLAKIFVFVDIFRGMLVSGLLVGLFCGMSTVYLEKLPEVIYEKTTERVDYHWNRQILVVCIVIGIIICAVDIMMALALDNILTKNLGRASLIWMNISLVGIVMRCGFYTLLWKNEEYLGLDRLAHDMPPTVKWAAGIIFTAAVAYEVIKVAQLIVGVASQMEFQNEVGLPRKKQVAPKRGGMDSKGWID